jgi:hypothetical protein
MKIFLSLRAKKTKRPKALSSDEDEDEDEDEDRVREEMRGFIAVSSTLLNSSPYFL